MASHPTPEAYASIPLVVLVADLSGYHRALRSGSDADMASFLDAFFLICEDVITDEGGRIIKFLGDAVLATFPNDRAQAAVAAATRLEARSVELADERGYDLKLGANLHMGPVVAGELGSGGSRRFDVIGRTVNQAFLLGRGRGIRISERVYRQLPSGDRSPWEKIKQPTFYTLGGLSG